MHYPAESWIKRQKSKSKNSYNFKQRKKTDMRNYLFPIGMWVLFETIAITLWLTLDHIFYLINFSYIGTCLSVGIFFYIKKFKYARNIVQFSVGLYMMLLLGIVAKENMQIEGFWYFLFFGSISGSSHSLFCSQNLRTVSFRTRLVRLCLLDRDGARSFAL